MVIRRLMMGLKPAIRARRAVWGPRRPSWNLKLETVAEVMRRGAIFSTVMPVEWQRRIIDPAREPSGPVRRTRLTHVDVGGVRGAWIDNDACDQERVILYLHGGGYSTGSISSHHDFMARLCEASGVRVLAIDYRLAPEHPYPAQLQDARAAYAWLLAQGVRPEHVVVAGESAGGGLTLSLLVSLRDEGQPLPAAGVLISAWLDLDPTAASFHTNRHYDYVTLPALRAWARRVADPVHFRDPLLSPVHADFTGLPPLLIQVGGAETLLDDNLRAADRARAAGVCVELEVWDDMIHAWHMFAPFLDDARLAIKGIAAFAVERMAAA